MEFIRIKIMIIVFLQICFTFIKSSSKTIMVGNDRIYLTPLHIHQNQHQANAPHLFWRVQKLPHEYVSANWPIKVHRVIWNNWEIELSLQFVASDPKTSHIVAIAGTKGFCYFDVKVQKWRLFRKEAQVCCTNNLLPD